MEEDDDDLYDPTDVAPSGYAAQNTEQQSGDAGMTEGQGHEQVEEEEEEEEEEDDEVCANRLFYCRRPFNWLTYV